MSLPSLCPFITKLSDDYINIEYLTNIYGLLDNERQSLSSIVSLERWCYYKFFFSVSIIQFPVGYLGFLLETENSNYCSLASS